MKAILEPIYGVNFVEPSSKSIEDRRTMPYHLDCKVLPLPLPSTSFPSLPKKQKRNFSSAFEPATASTDRVLFRNDERIRGLLSTCYRFCQEPPGRQTDNDHETAHSPPSSRQPPWRSACTSKESFVFKQSEPDTSPVPAETVPRTSYVRRSVSIASLLRPKPPTTACYLGG